LGDAPRRLFPDWDMELINLETSGETGFDVSEIRGTLIDPSTGMKAPVAERGKIILEALASFQDRPAQEIGDEAA
jgi:hypothetical protein